MVTPMNTRNLYEFSKLESWSVCAENPTGEKGAANLTKTNSYVSVEPWSTFVLCDIQQGCGMVRSIWLTISDRSPETMRSCIIRMYWDNSPHPSVAAPLGDFFGVLHGRTAHYTTPYLSTPEGKGFNCFFPMPFESRCRIEIENDSPARIGALFYQINYTLGDDIGDSCGRFHAHFRRETPPRGEDFVMLDVKGTPGVYVGTVVGALPLEPKSWREGEIRWFIDGDRNGATICGTGWSDYFLSAWGLGIFDSVYGGSNYQVIHPIWKERYYCSCYRFHIPDPIYFQDNLKVAFEQRGFVEGMDGFQPRQDDWSSVVYWYQRITESPLPPLPTRERRLEKIHMEAWELDAYRRRLSGIDNLKYDDRFD